MYLKNTYKTVFLEERGRGGEREKKNASLNFELICFLVLSFPSEEKLGGLSFESWSKHNSAVEQCRVKFYSKLA